MKIEVAALLLIKITGVQRRVMQELAFKGTVLQMSTDVPN